MLEPSIENVFACKLDAELPLVPGKVCSWGSGEWDVARFHLEQLHTCREQRLASLGVARMDGDHVGRLEGVRSGSRSSHRSWP